MSEIDFYKVMRKEIDPIYRPTIDEEIDIQIRDSVGSSQKVQLCQGSDIQKVESNE